MNFQFLELFRVYRMVKSHLYAQTSRPRLFSLLHFESDLCENLNAILSRLTGGDSESFIKKCKGFCLVPNQVESHAAKNSSFVFVASDRSEGEGALERGTVYYKSFSNIPIECELVFALWVYRVGVGLDKAFGEHVFGGRLAVNRTGKFSPYSPHLYRTFHEDYLKWRNAVMEELSKAMATKRDVLVFSSELRMNAVCDRFGQCCFEDFLHGLKDEDVFLTKLVFGMLENWRAECPAIARGVPLGSTIEGFISNFVLQRLDQSIRDRIHPIYYSRCGMAFTVVIEDNGRTPKDFFSRVTRVTCEALKGETKGKNAFPRGVFQSTKTRVLRLTGSSGADFVEALSSAVQEDEQLWRRLPESPDTTKLIKEMHTPFGRQGNECDLLQVGQTTLSKRRFTKQIQNMETFLRCLNLGDWREQRLDFLNTVNDSFLDLKSFLCYFSLYPRILSIAFSSSANEYSPEFRVAVQMIKKIVEHLRGICNGRWQDSADDNEEQVRNSLMGSFRDCVYEQLCSNMQDDAVRKKLVESIRRTFPDLFTFGSDEIPNYHCLQKFDLATVPFKDFIMEQVRSGRIEKESDWLYAPRELMQEIDATGRMMLQKLWSAMSGTSARGKIPLALLLSTRAIDLTDLYLVMGIPENEKCAQKYKKVLEVLNGGLIENALPRLPDRRCGEEYVVVRSPVNADSIKIGLVSWLVEHDSWTAMAKNKVDPYKRDRFKRLMRIANLVADMDSDKRPQYLLFPELSMPPKLFLKVARFLSGKNVSVIAGVDYVHLGENRDGVEIVEDQAWCSLCYAGSGKGHPVIIKFVKSKPAQREERRLYDVACAKYNKRSSFAEHPLLVCHGMRHDNLCFTELICSDLLDVNRRAELRGKVDLLMISAWNRDVNVYSSLVESAANDIHSYVALCNSREYGDTRLRAPYVESYRRDIVRLKGGKEDYFVVGEIDVKTLRRFQSAFRSPAEPFKPTPTGFVVSRDREMLP